MKRSSRGLDKLARWISKAVTPDTPAVIGGDFNVAPEDVDVWDPQACHGGTHVSERERKAFGRLSSAGSSMRTDYITRSRGATRGGTTTWGISIRTSACASITYW